MMEKEILEILKSLEQGQNKIASKLDETYEIVRALEHSAQINKAEHDKMANDIVNS
ncbi:MAG: hypothetical protein K0R06_3576 [Clostridium sp.]|nr:hypothetical protein [Clostridium sp.]